MLSSDSEHPYALPQLPSSFGQHSPSEGRHGRHEDLLLACNVGIYHDIYIYISLSVADFNPSEQSDEVILGLPS